MLVTRVSGKMVSGTLQCMSHAGEKKAQNGLNILHKSDNAGITAIEEHSRTS